MSESPANLVDQSAPRVCAEGSQSPAELKSKNQRLAIVTTSWDDGAASDLKVAELLLSRGLKGTFYVPLSGYKSHPPLRREEMRFLSANDLEIGGHGATHRTLTGLPLWEVVQEVGSSKKHLEDVLGKHVDMFCYPRGRLNAEVVRCVQQAGYRGARTTRMLAHALSFSLFEMPTTLQVFPHTRGDYLRNLLKARNFAAHRTFLANYPSLNSWVELGKALFDDVAQRGGIWHLFGHSWEIEKLGLWEDLQNLLDYVCRREGVIYSSNCQALHIAQLGVSPRVDETIS
ncbi:MAG: polysaccharide deacetylase family protein [Candidatus Acidiferrales bacterium]